MELNILEPVVQYGFLGFSVVLLAVVIWLIQRLTSLLEASNRVISDNTQAIRLLAQRSEDLLEVSRSLHERVITRPCLIQGREG